MNRCLLLALLIAATGCADDKDADATCNELCDLLVQECGYTAYPSKSSCAQGCLYNQEQGADIEGQLECIQDADGCDTFAIAECEHAYGE